MARSLALPPAPLPAHSGGMPRHADAIAAERYRLDEHRKTSLYKHKPQAAPQKSRRSRLTTEPLPTMLLPTMLLQTTP